MKVFNHLKGLLTVSFIILNSELEYVDGFNISLKQMSGYYISPEALEVNKIDIIKHHKKQNSNKATLEPANLSLYEDEQAYTESNKVNKTANEHDYLSIDISLNFFKIQNIHEPVWIACS